MLNFLKRLKPDPDGVEDDSQYYTGQSYYQGQDQHYYAPNQQGYDPYAQGHVVNQPQQFHSDLYHQAPGYNGAQYPQSQPGQGYYGYNQYPGQYYNFAQPGMAAAPDPGQMGQMPQPSQPPQPVQPAQPDQQKTVIDSGISQLNSLDHDDNLQGNTADKLDPKLQQKDEQASELPQTKLNSLDQEMTDPNAGLTETNTIPADVKPDEQNINVDQLKAVADQAMTGREPSPKSESVQAVDDPLEKLMKLVKDKEGKVDERKLKKLFVVVKNKLSNEYLNVLVNTLRQENASDKDIVQVMLNIDKLVEDGEIDNKFFTNFMNSNG